MAALCSPSQIRYAVEYFGALLEGARPRMQPLLLKRIVFSGLPDLTATEGGGGDAQPRGDADLVSSALHALDTVAHKAEIGVSAALGTVIEAASKVVHEVQGASAPGDNATAATASVSATDEAQLGAASADGEGSAAPARTSSQGTDSATVGAPPVAARSAARPTVRRRGCRPYAQLFRDGKLIYCSTWSASEVARETGITSGAPASAAAGNSDMRPDLTVADDGIATREHRSASSVGPAATPAPAESPAAAAAAAGDDEPRDDAGLRWVDMDEGAVKFDVSAPVNGDVLLRVRHFGENGARVTLARALLHTGYVENFVLGLERAAIDVAGPVLPEESSIELVFEALPSDDPRFAAAAAAGGMMADELASDAFWAKIEARKAERQARASQRLRVLQHEQRADTDMRHGAGAAQGSSSGGSSARPAGSKPQTASSRRGSAGASVTPAASATDDGDETPAEQASTFASVVHGGHLVANVANATASAAASAFSSGFFSLLHSAQAAVAVPVAAAGAGVASQSSANASNSNRHRTSSSGNAGSAAPPASASISSASAATPGSKVAADRKPPTLSASGSSGGAAPSPLERELAQLAELEQELGLALDATGAGARTSASAHTAAEAVSTSAAAPSAPVAAPAASTAEAAAGPPATAPPAGSNSAATAGAGGASDIDELEAFLNTLQDK